MSSSSFTWLVVKCIAHWTLACFVNDIIVGSSLFISLPEKTAQHFDNPSLETCCYKSVYVSYSTVVIVAISRQYMSASESAVRGNATNIPLPPQLIVGSDRILAVLWYTYLCIVSLIIELVFIIVSFSYLLCSNKTKGETNTLAVQGTRRLCGWDSNFCFTLLIILSVMCMVRFATELIASLTALFYMDWIEYQFLWIVGFWSVFHGIVAEL